MASVDKDPTRTKTPYVVRWRDEKGKQRKRGFARKLDADRFRAEVEHGLNTGTFIDPNDGAITFSAFFEDWAKRQIWVSGTDRAMRLAAGSVTFSAMPLRLIRRSHVEAWVKRESERLAASTVKTRFNNVRSVFRAAVTDRMIPLDPTAGVTLPRQRRAEAAMVIPTPAQVRDLLERADSRFRCFVALAAFAGLRLGEAAALRVSAVDFLRRQLEVVLQVQRANGGTVELRAPKYGSERVVYLPPALVEEIAVHIAEHVPGEDRDRWIFPGEGHDPWHQNTVGYYWRRCRSAAGLPSLRLHDLRHFYASGLIAAGCDVVTVQRALGHKSATVTLKTYAHLWPSAEDRTRAAAAAMMAETFGVDVPTVRPTDAQNIG